MSTQPPSQSPTTTKSKGKTSQNSEPSQSLKAHWDTKSIEIFVKLCVEQVKAGHRLGTHLDRVGWEAVINKFKIATGTLYVRLQLKNRWDTLKKEWDLWKNLLRGETGLELDPLTGAIMASDDWWNLKLQAYTPSSGVFIDTKGSHTPLGDDTDIKIHPSELSNQCRRQKEGLSKKQKGNKKQSAAGELNKTLNRIVNAIEASSSTGTQDVTMQNPHTITECLAKISTISNISEGDDLLVWAARLFMKSSLCEFFMALPNDVLRLKFINLEIALEKAHIFGYRD
ncbi:L10-interacting MYB domain-containing protein-like [Camellia sinensis]|uniref:L10-interacting MYB domain-containing protein-like n=1 Tax=Camellia sinensis TaxID=4442 RepID=UPI0010361B54|nr:L10-interacting MYB domain-containing protein-like [Camellia sinensis]